MNFLLVCHGKYFKCQICHICHKKKDCLAYARLEAIRGRLKACKPTVWPKQNINPNRWRLFLLDVAGCESSIYMMRWGAHIPLSGMPFRNNPLTFPRLKTWQRAAALEVVYQYVKEGKVLGPFPGRTRTCPITGHPLFFYPSFVVPKTKPGAFR